MGGGRFAAGIHLAVVLGAAISSSWDLSLKVLVTSFRFLGKGKHRAETCSIDVTCSECRDVNNLQEQLRCDAELLCRCAFRL